MKNPIPYLNRYWQARFKRPAPNTVPPSPIPSVPDIETSHQAFATHQQHIDAMEKATHASQTLARSPHEHDDGTIELKEPPAR